MYSVKMSVGMKEKDKRDTVERFRFSGMLLIPYLRKKTLKGAF